MGITATGRQRNRSWPEALKREIFAASFAGSSVSIVARHYDVNATHNAHNDGSHASGWAGFVRGMELRKRDWADLLNDEQNGGWLVPILALAHEHSLDAGMRPYKEPISAERREQLIAGAAAGVRGIYRHFQAKRLQENQLRSTTVRRV